MPIFNNEVTFIHIPKSGGFSIEKTMLRLGHSIDFYSKDNYAKVKYVTGQYGIHPAQHSTFLELQNFNMIRDKTFTVIRNEVDRTVSEYFWGKHHMKISFDKFLDKFLRKDSISKFDNHNLPNRVFIHNEFGEVDERITVFDFFDSDGISNFLGIDSILKTNVTNSSKKFTPNSKQRDRIENYFNEF